MKFNQVTASVLKNFAAINQSVKITKGNVVKTISPQKSVMAIATLDQDMEGDACIYDLPRFISTLSLFDEPEISFQPNKFLIKGGKSKVNYTFASESMILTPPDREITLPSVDVKVDLSWIDFDKVMKASSVLKLTDIAFVGDKEGIKLAAIDVNNSTADSFSIQLSEEAQEKAFTYVFRTDNLKFIPGDYSVEISSKGISKFQNDRVTYFVATEASSKVK